MARIRTIKPSLFSSLTVCAWPMPIRFTFIGLFTYLDDEGRGLDEPRLVKAELYPLDDLMTLYRVRQHLDAIAESGPLCRYELDAHRYLHITSWLEHQRVNRPSKSKVPPCPIHDKLIEGNGNGSCPIH